MTGIMRIGSRQQLAKVEPGGLNVGDNEVLPVDSFKKLGVWCDKNMNMITHINKMFNATYFYLHNIKRIRKFLTKESTEILIYALVMERSNYCNSLLFGLSSVHPSKPKRIQNSAARLVCSVPRYKHITPVIPSPHWLPIIDLVPERSEGY